MASPVRSTQFISAAGFTGPAVTQYVVPGGYVAVVKCITIVWGNVSVSGVDAWVQTDDLCKLWRYTWASTVGDLTNYGGSSLFWGAAALIEGTEIQVQTAAGTVDFQASGYLLELA